MIDLGVSKSELYSYISKKLNVSEEELDFFKKHIISE